ncbi:MAG TPA: protein-disulfide reductase DsbD, partial [Arenimonas sp.]|nr:protein-disulfide reductase DsbD [Arenimonas sp.]
MPRSECLRRLRAGATALLALCWLLPATATAAIDPDDLLPVDQAFALTASAPAPGRIVLRWKIADGYYLYRHRMDADIVGGDFRAKGLQLPAGKRHVDEFFGEVETYRGAVQAVLPGRGEGTVTVRVKYQGCADLGICYPPQARDVQVTLPGAAASEGLDLAPAAGGLLQRAAPASLLGTGDEPLPEAQAFGFDAIARDAGTLLLRFAPAPGYYLYRDRTAIELSGPAAQATGLSAGALQWPPGTSHEDEFFGRTTVYFEPVEVALPLHRARAGGGALTVTASFQGCQDEGICYPPMTRTVELLLPEGAASLVSKPPASSSPAPASAASVATTETAEPEGSPATDVSLAAEAAPASTNASADASAPALGEDQRLAAKLAGQGRGVALLLFLGAGLLLAFTPCVLPMIPILSGLIAGASAAHGGRLGSGRALALSSVYILANALVFTAAGVVAGLLGANLQVAFQHPWVITAFAALFVALALSMFGLYELQLPSALRARLGEVADRQRGGSWPGVAAMGALSALIVGPCVAPPLAAAVLYIGQTRDPVFGGAALFALAIGMGLPLLAFGVA